MKAERFGSYSSRSTVAGMSNLRRLKSIDAVGALVPAAAPARGDAAEIVAAAGLGQALGQRLYRLALVEPRAVDDHQLALARRRRIVMFSVPWLCSSRPF